jgi:hypothetical protein
MRDLSWKSYHNGRLIAEHPDGFFVIIPADRTDTVPIFCSICEFALMSIYDEETYRKLECCDKCAAKWAYPKMSEWKSGWRPSAEDIQQEIKARTTLE